MHVRIKNLKSISIDIYFAFSVLGAAACMEEVDNVVLSKSYICHTEKRKKEK